MGSSAMGASILRDKVKKAGLSIDVTNRAISNLSDAADTLVVTQEELAPRAAQMAPSSTRVAVSNFLNSPKYDDIIESLTGSTSAAQTPVAQAVSEVDDEIDLNLIDEVVFAHDATSVGSATMGKETILAIFRNHVPDLIENGVNSFKIEGRMKSIHYVSTVSNVYKKAVDAYLESPETFEQIKPALVDELWKVAQRELATGFYYQTPSENEQLFGARRKIPQYKFVGEVVAFDAKTMTVTVRQRNVITEGDEIEFYGPGFRHVTATVENLRNEDGERIDRAPNPMELLTMTVPTAVEPGDMIRKNGSGLINLYEKNGVAKTVRV